MSGGALTPTAHSVAARRSATYLFYRQGNIHRRIYQRIHQLTSDCVSGTDAVPLGNQMFSLNDQQ